MGMLSKTIGFRFRDPPTPKMKTREFIKQGELKWSRCQISISHLRNGRTARDPIPNLLWNPSLNRFDH